MSWKLGKGVVCVVILCSISMCASSPKHDQYKCRNLDGLVGLARGERPPGMAGVRLDEVGSLGTLMAA